ncbi:MAG TPA: hypothetical protein VE664_05350, partial [Actinomycetes bacterium]|nr:hypothetical protein [Actinomycetes bacterium]
NPAALARLGCRPADAHGAAPTRVGSRPFVHLGMVERRLADWLQRTHHASTGRELLDWYLDEFTFRFNRRSARHRGLLFYRLLEEALVTPPQPYGAMLPPGRERPALRHRPL